MRIAEYFERLWPLNRSLTGEGTRRSLDILAEVMPMQRLRFPSGSQVFDWIVPDEWEAHEASFVDSQGQRRADFGVNNLHLLGYSEGFQGTVSLAELKAHLYTLPEQPEAIPYVTSYYRRRWGFCLSQREADSLPDGPCEVTIKARHFPGYVEIGEAFLPGDSPDEVLFSSYVCHPSMANNELSGPLVVAFLYDALKERPRRYSYRFLLSVETIGTICYLSQRGHHLRERLVAGYQVTCAGDPGPFTYKRSRRGDSLADRAAQAVLRGRPHSVVDFDPANGSDERQWCSPGFNLPVGSLMRTMYSRYPEYHTSLDNRDFISFDALAETVDVYLEVVEALESNQRWQSTNPCCEPQLGPRGLYPTVGSHRELEAQVGALMWVLNLADGAHDLLAMAHRSGYSVASLAGAARKLEEAGLLRREEPR